MLELYVHNFIHSLFSQLYATLYYVYTSDTLRACILLPTYIFELINFSTDRLWFIVVIYMSVYYIKLCICMEK